MSSAGEVAPQGRTVGRGAGVGAAPLAEADLRGATRLWPLVQRPSGEHPSVNSLSLVRFDGNDYSVPTAYTAGKSRRHCSPWRVVRILPRSTSRSRILPPTARCCRRWDHEEDRDEEHDVAQASSEGPETADDPGRVRPLGRRARQAARRAIAAQCAKENVDHLGFLLQLCEQELIDRERRAAQRRLKTANFPTRKTLEDFDFSAARLPPGAQAA